jgi:hypothetical protein
MASWRHWAAIINDHEKSFLHMANCGWTLPDWIDLGDLRTLHLKSPEELDRYFVEGFMANDTENLKELGNTLNSPWLKSGFGAIQVWVQNV